MDELLLSPVCSSPGESRTRPTNCRAKQGLKTNKVTQLSMFHSLENLNFRLEVQTTVSMLKEGNVRMK